VIGLPLETRRLRIRRFRPAEDAEPLHELWGDPEAMRFVRPDRAPTTIADTRARLEDIVRRPSGWGVWAIEERAGGRLVGAAGLFPLEWQGPEIEVAYHVVPSAWGRGYATEAAAGLLEAAWRETDLEEIVAVAFEGNRASTRVMEKLGMTYTGRVRYRGHEVVRYSIARPTTAEAGASETV
jgi:[ribosomal protein S5]-alanine N-acetyltransferase